MFSHRPGAVLFINVISAAMATEKSEWQYRQYTEDLKIEDSTMLDSDLYLSRNPCFLTALALSPSLLFRFIFFSVKIIWKQFLHKFQKNGEHSFCSRNTSLALNCLWIQSWDYTMHNTETNTMAVRSRETWTCTAQNPEQGIFQTGKQTNHKTGLEIFMIFFLFCF